MHRYTKIHIYMHMYQYTSMSPLLAAACIGLHPCSSTVSIFAPRVMCVCVCTWIRDECRHSYIYMHHIYIFIYAYIYTCTVRVYSCMNIHVYVHVYVMCVCARVCTYSQTWNHHETQANMCTHAQLKTRRRNHSPARAAIHCIFSSMRVHTQVLDTRIINQQSTWVPSQNSPRSSSSLMHSMDPTDVAQCNAVLSSSSTSSRPASGPPRASTARSSCGVCVCMCMCLMSKRNVRHVAHTHTHTHTHVRLFLCTEHLFIFCRLSFSYLFCWCVCFSLCVDVREQIASSLFLHTLLSSASTSFSCVKHNQPRYPQLSQQPKW